jgi:hypothetical protein
VQAKANAEQLLLDRGWSGQAQVFDHHKKGAWKQLKELIPLS